MNRMARSLLVSVVGMWMASCAVLHKVQLAEVDGENVSKGKKISVKVSETTVDFNEAGRMIRNIGVLARSREANDLGRAFEYYAFFFQFGPMTGTQVFHELYARNLPDALATQCRGGRLTDVISVREARSYTIVKGEIVRVDAVCVGGKGDKP